MNVSSARYFDDFPRAMRMYDIPRERMRMYDIPRAMRMYDYRSYQDDSPAPRDRYFRSYREDPQAISKGYTLDGKNCLTKCRFGSCYVRDENDASGWNFVSCTLEKAIPVATKAPTKVKGYATDGSGRECVHGCSAVTHKCFVRNPSAYVACA